MDYGYKWKTHPIHCNKNETVIEFLLHERKWLGRVTNEMFARHFSGEDTFYFAGNSWGVETLFMIDIDCHKRGSLAGAMAFAQFLKENFFPNLYFEASTNGQGVHGYCLIVKTTDDVENVNALLLDLGKALDEYLTLHPFDVEMVEIKGLSPVITISNRKLTNYKAGTLAKLPRAKDRFEELKATTRFTVEELADLVESIKEKSGAVVPVPEVKGKKKVKRPVCGSVRGTHIDVDLLPKYVKFAQTILGRTNEQEKQKQKEKTREQKRLHSTHGAWETNAYFITANTARLAGEDEGSGQGILRTKGRTVVTALDLAVFLLELKFFTLNMNIDGSMPTERFKVLWEKMIERGDIDRAWDYKRFAAMRNYVSSLGWLEWEDERYYLGPQGKKGKAAKWRATEELMGMLTAIEREEKEETSLTGTPTEEEATTSIDLSKLIQNRSFIRPIQVIELQKWIDYRPILREMGLLVA